MVFVREGLEKVEVEAVGRINATLDHLGSPWTAFVRCLKGVWRVDSSISIGVPQQGLGRDQVSWSQAVSKFTEKKKLLTKNLRVQGGVTWVSHVPMKAVGPMSCQAFLGFLQVGLPHPKQQDPLSSPWIGVDTTISAVLQEPGHH